MEGALRRLVTPRLGGNKNSMRGPPLVRHAMEISPGKLAESRVFNPRLFSPKSKLYFVKEVKIIDHDFFGCAI